MIAEEQEGQSRRKAYTLEGVFKEQMIDSTYFPNQAEGIVLTREGFEPFSQGAFYAVHDDGNVAAFSWADLGDALGLRTDCVAA